MIPPGSQRDLVDVLHDLHHRTGWPSLRVLAREAGCSHTTVSAVFSSPRLPGWGVLEVLVAAMDGNVAQFRCLAQHRRERGFLQSCAQRRPGARGVGVSASEGPASPRSSGM
jgi:lambda repressor-like predicted transcriptional regulator